MSGQKIEETFSLLGEGIAKLLRAPFAKFCIGPKHPKDFFPHNRRNSSEITRKGLFIQDWRNLLSQEYGDLIFKSLVLSASWLLHFTFKHL